jgi:uncharacterized protein (TIGR02594 family)
MNFIEWAQRRLIAHGFNPGMVDGEWGRRTLNATIAFQNARGLPAGGQLNSVTVQALRSEPGGVPPARKPAEPPKQDLLDKFPWIRLALRKKGLHEGRDNADLRKFLKSDGSTLGDPARLPWCGDFVETCIAVTLPEAVVPVNPYLARNWLKFGQTVDPCFGAVMVFWRGSRSGTSGHVGFYYSEHNDVFNILGGNQRDSVSVTSLKKNRFLGARLPNVGGPYPRHVVTKSGDFALTENEF